MLQNGEGGPVFFGHAVFVKTDIKIIAPNSKIQGQRCVAVSLMDMINGLSLGNIDKPFKSKKGAQQTAAQHQHNT